MRDLTMNAEELLRKAQPFPYISFDLFDTLMFRTFDRPEDVFEAVEYAYNEKHSPILKNFRKARQKAELDARKEYGEQEITIDGIYRHLPYEKSVCDQLEKLEKQIEIENCVPNESMLKFLRCMQKNGKKIIIATDMYLDPCTIQAILKKLNVDSYILFLSSQRNATKISGRLFPFILHALEIDASQIIHIGDNPVSDIQKAEEAGICSCIRLKSEIPIKLYGEYERRYSIAYGHIHALVREMSALKDDNSPEYRIGYGVLGPIAAEFCSWVHEKVREEKAGKIVFVSREGYLLRNIYRTLYPEEEERTDYICLNKNLLRFPALYLNTTVSQFLDTIPMRDHYSLEELLNYLFIDKQDEFLFRLRKKETMRRDMILSRKAILEGQYDDFFASIFSALERDLKRQFEYLIDYLTRKGIIGNHSLLVNNSINGNGQIMLENILRQASLKGSLYGVQFVCSRKCRHRLGKRCEGWLTDGGLPLSYTMNFNRYALLLEHLLFESAGTALYFERRESGVHALIEDQREEQKNNDIVDKIQKYAMDFTADYRNHVALHAGCKIIKLMARLFECPYFEDVKLLNRLYDDDMNGDRPLIEAVNWITGKAVLKKAAPIQIRKMIWQIKIEDYFKAIGSEMKDFLKL